MGSVGAPDGIQGTRTIRAPYASQPLFGRGNVPRPWHHPGQRVVPPLSSTQKKALGGRPTRAFSHLEGQCALASRSVVEAQRIAGSPLCTDRPATCKTNSNRAITRRGRFRGRADVVRSTQYSLLSSSQGCSLPRNVQNSGRGSLWMRGSLSTTFFATNTFFATGVRDHCRNACEATSPSAAPVHIGRQSERYRPLRDSRPPESR